jgi:glycosidase
MERGNKLIYEIHNRDKKIVLDLVLKHTSDKYLWFIESRLNQDNPIRDLYTWNDGKGKKPKNH